MTSLAKIGWLHIAYAIALMFVGVIVAQKVSQLVEQSVAKRYSRHQALLIRRLLFYGLIMLFAVSALQQLGFKMSAILGAAGIFTVALSFASQTAASNLVSGVFLFFESPFKVGDTIQVKDMKGTIESIDLLSTKINTPDNMRIRIPNETLMKSEIINMSSSKTRRISIMVGVAYDTDINKAKEVLLELASENKKVLSKPEPQVSLDAFADSAINLQLLAWTKTADATKVKNEIHEAIKIQFEKAVIEMPFPHVTISKG